MVQNLIVHKRPISEARLNLISYFNWQDCDMISNAEWFRITVIKIFVNTNITIWATSQEIAEKIIILVLKE